jgi:threonine aldolase
MPGENGKINPASIEAAVKKRTTTNHPKPRALSFAQATEMGTVYSPDELRALTEIARRSGLGVHMDGARFANAVASLGVAPKEITWRAGVDVLSFGGTKNGMAIGEAVVFFNLDLAKEFDYRCKQAGQLASKMRFMSACWTAMLQDGAWLRHATHANEMAKRLENGLRGLPHVKLSFPCDANGVFAKMPLPIIQGMYDLGWKFYTHVSPNDCRLMCSWDTTEQDVDGFVADLKGLVEKT